MDEYATYLPALAAAVARTSGGVLEFGCGYYSTPLLHELCAGYEGRAPRTLLSAENDPEWLKKFSYFGTSWHRFYLVVSGWDAFSGIYRADRWSVALIDHSPGERRIVDILALKNLCEFIVVHDTENSGYGYEDAFSQFKYRTDCRRLTPHTTVVSQFNVLTVESLT